MEKKDEEIIKSIVENLKVYRGVFVRKSELIQKLEEAFPDEDQKNN